MSSSGARAIYLDWNATTPPSQRVLDAMRAAAERCWGNPASVHRVGREARELIEQVRRPLAKLLGVAGKDLLFTSGGTEANNLALADAPALVTSRLEHPSVVRVAEALAAQGSEVRWLSVGPAGQLDPGELERHLTELPAGARVAIQAVNHETGVCQPLAQFAEVTGRLAAWLHVDGVQALGKVPLEQLRVGDSVALAAHKCRGPKGLGVLAWRCGRPTPKPLLRGGAQERGLRPGTVDPVMVAGLGSLLDLLPEAHQRHEALRPLRDRLVAELGSLVESNFDLGSVLPHVASLFVPGWRGDELVAALDVEGVCVSSGSACSAGSAEPSPVLTASHGLARARGTLRVSLGETTTEQEVSEAVAIFARVLARRVA